MKKEGGGWREMTKREGKCANGMFSVYGESRGEDQSGQTAKRYYFNPYIQ